MVTAVIRDYKYTSLAELNAVLGQFNVMADRGKEGTAMFEKKGLIYSIIDISGNKTGVPFKASSLNGKPTLANLEPRFIQNEEKRKQFKEHLKACIENTFSSYQQITKATFIKGLAGQNVNAIFRQNEQGLTYGITFVDHRNKTVFNGSDLGKAYSAKAIGESPDSKQALASKENGKVNYVNNDFRPAYFSPAVKQTVYVDKGQGFSVSQAANLVQDRTVYRDDMMTRNGEPYKAWVRFDFDQPKDQYNNHKLKQFHDPSYGFNLEKTLGRYNIKELADPTKKEAVVQAMRNGDRVEVTAITKEDKELKVVAQAVPRYGKLDFFNEKGIGQKREQFERTVKTEQSHGKGQGKAKGQEESKSLSVR